MTQAEAEILVTRLVAAYPRERLDEANVALYVGRLLTLEHAETAYDAVTEVIDASPRFPTVAEIRVAYFARRRNALMARHALPEPRPSDEEAARMAAEGRALLARIGRRMP